jgi:hypothetical protein
MTRTVNRINQVGLPVAPRGEGTPCGCGRDDCDKQFWLSSSDADLVQLDRHFVVVAAGCDTKRPPGLRFMAERAGYKIYENPRIPKRVKKKAGEALRVAERKRGRPRKKLV